MQQQITNNIENSYRERNIFCFTLNTSHLSHLDEGMQNRHLVFLIYIEFKEAKTQNIIKTTIKCLWLELERTGMVWGERKHCKNLTQVKWKKHFCNVFCLLKYVHPMK